MQKKLPDYTTFYDPTDLEPFSKIRLIALDLDGTLLTSKNSNIPSKVKQLTNSLKMTHQVTVTIATGRTLSGAKLIFENLPKYKTTPAILYNGGLIVNSDYNILKKWTIPLRNMWQVVNICSSLPVTVLAYTGFGGNLGNDELRESVFGWTNLERTETEYNGLPVNWQSWSKREIKYESSAMVIHVFKNKEIMGKICEKLRFIDNIAFTRGGDIYIEVSPINCNKGIALKYIADYLSFKREQVLAMGDNDNDAPMLKWAGLGIAVESASKLAKDSSDYIAKGVIEGAIEVLRLVKQSRMYLNRTNGI